MKIPLTTRLGVLLWCAAAVPLRAVEAVVWVLWQSMLWLYRISKSARMSVECWDLHGPGGEIENVEMGPTCWDYLPEVISIQKPKC